MSASGHKLAAGKCYPITGNADTQILFKTAYAHSKSEGLRPQSPEI
jgi:hypothetical protein